MLRLKKYRNGRRRRRHRYVRLVLQNERKERRKGQRKKKKTRCRMLIFICVGICFFACQNDRLRHFIAIEQERKIEIISETQENMDGNLKEELYQIFLRLKTGELVFYHQSKIRQ